MVLNELRGSLQKAKKSIYEYWQYYKNFWKLSQPRSSFKYLEADYQQSVEYHLSISSLLLLNHTGLFFAVVSIWWEHAMSGLFGKINLGPKINQTGESTLSSSFNERLFSIKDSTLIPSKSLYQKISKTSIFFLSGAFISYAYNRSWYRKLYTEKSHFFWILIKEVKVEQVTSHLLPLFFGTVPWPEAY